MSSHEMFDFKNGRSGHKRQDHLIFCHVLTKQLIYYERSVKIWRIYPNLNQILTKVIETVREKYYIGAIAHAGKT